MRAAYGDFLFLIMDNTVIEVLDKEHGKKVIEWFKSQGVYTSSFMGECSKAEENPYRFYGIKEGSFKNLSYQEVKNSGLKIITLPEEKAYPRVMEVSDQEDGQWKRRVVFMEKKGCFFSWVNAETLKDSDEEIHLVTWKYAREIQEPSIMELTIDEIATKFGVSPNQIKIKK